MGSAALAPAAVDVSEALQAHTPDVVLWRLRNSSDKELRGELEQVDPSVMLRMTGPQGYKVKRFLIMREDLLPPSWDSYFRRHALDLFVPGLEADIVLQRLLLSRRWMRSSQLGHSSQA
jgi:hypothetical protein